MSSEIKKCEIQKLVNLRSERVSEKVNEGKSEVWKFFSLILLDGEVVPFVKCNKCLTVLSWKSRDGTNGLRAHRDFCTSQSHTQQKLAAVPGFSCSPKVPAGVKSDVTNTVVRMCAKDLRYV